MTIATLIITKVRIPARTICHRRLCPIGESIQSESYRLTDRRTSQAHTRHTSQPLDRIHPDQRTGRVYGSPPYGRPCRSTMDTTGKERLYKLHYPTGRTHRPLPERRAQLPGTLPTAGRLHSDREEVIRTGNR